jgi:hypothetical protein
MHLETEQIKPLILTYSFPHPFPQLELDGNRVWVSKKKLIALDEVAPAFHILFRNGKKQVSYSTAKLQQSNADTCGRWVVARLKNADKSIDDFVDWFRSGPGTPDEKVTEYTFKLLHK